MTLPLSFDRVLAALKRISPPWPFTDADTSVGKELGSIAVAIGTAADPLDTVMDEVIPDTTTQLIDRWEGVARVATRATDDIVTRRGRVLAVLRRASGARLDQLDLMLADSLDLDLDDIVFVEQLREFIDDALLQTDTNTYAINSTPLPIVMGAPWPGLVDSTGVRLTIAMSAPDSPVITITSPRGTVWNVSAIADSPVTYETRTKFLGEPAGGRWIVTVSDDVASSVTELQLLVSNDVDASQIYNFFVLRDPALPGTADLVEAQRLFHRTALGHMKSFVIESFAAVVDDPHSLCDRDPVGI